MFPNPGFEREMTCRTWGQYNFETFDGLYYHFPGQCSYTLLKDCEDTTQASIVVQVHNDPGCSSAPYTCRRSVSLFLPWEGEVRLHATNVTYKGQSLQLPHHIHDLQLEHISQYVLVTQQHGFTLAWEGRSGSVYIKLSPEFVGRTCGLCGNFNADVQDDLRTSYGVLTHDIELFGNSWVETEPHEARCPMVPSGFSSPCAAVETHVLLKVEEVCAMLLDPPFQSCHDFVSPLSYMASCSNDLCMSGPNGDVVCQVFSEYARACAHADHPLHDWRQHIPQCAKQCALGLQYRECISCCPASCNLERTCIDSKLACLDGCYCPDGMIFEDGGCVTPSDCPCEYHGMFYPSGQTLQEECNNCTCVGGVWNCTDYSCPGECSVTGDMYFQSFDGRIFTFPATCQYVLAKSRNSGKFTVTIQNAPCGSSSVVVRLIRVCLRGPVSLSTTYLLKHGDECFEPASCPCLWKGKEYYPGDRVSSPCHHCVCQHGTFQCVFHPCPSMCMAYGDRHYRTFDGLLFDYVGACKVYLVKSSADVMLSVTAENIDCFDSGVICRKSLLISIGRSFVAFDDDTGKPNPSSVIDRKQRMFIWPAGYFTVVHFPEEDVTVLWDRRTTIHIQVGPRWQGKLSGLCGNFDMKTVNEMRTPDNIDSPTAQEFGNSWTAAECVNSPDIRHPCSLSPLREPFAKRRCGVLLSEVFQACHPVVDVTWFYMNCLADTCACSRGGDCECFCTSVAAYAQRCCHQGVPVDWRSPSLCPYDCEFYNKVLGKGPFRLISFRDETMLLAASSSSGSVFLQRGNLSATAAPGVLSQFMMTPGLSRARPHDTSRVSFEAADRPNYFLYVSPSGQVGLAKWEESKAFWDGATFVLHRNTWISGYDSLESHAKLGFFLHATMARLHLLKYRHIDSFRKATLFRLTGPSLDAVPGPRCQWRYDSCVIPCFKTCSDPSAEACVTIPQVEGCLPVCPPHMVLDEVTRRCVYVEDCIKVPVAVQPVTPSTAPLTSAAVTSATTTSSAASTTPFQTTSTSTSTTVSSAPLHSGPTTKITTTSPAVSTQTTLSKAPPAPDEQPTHPVTVSTAAPELSKTAGPPSPPTVAPTVRPEVEEPLSTVRVTEVLSTTVAGTTAWTTRAVSSTTSPFGPSTSRTSSTPLAITALFWVTSSTKPTDLLQPLFTTTATTLQPSTPASQTTSSVEQPTTISNPPPVAVQPTKEYTEATTHSAAVTPIVTTSSPSPAPVSETSTVTDRTTVTSTATTAYTETSTKTVTVEQLHPTTTTPIPPGLPSTASTTSSSLPTSPPVETRTVSLPTVTSSKTMESVTPGAPFTTSKTTLSASPETTSAPATTEKILHSTPIVLKTSSTTVPELPKSTPIHVVPTSTSPSALTSDRRTTTIKVTIIESTVTEIPLATTTTAAPPPLKITTTSPVSTSTTYAERTSWSAAVPTEKTTQTTTSRPPEVPETSTVSTGPSVTTKPTVPPVSPIETTAVPLLPTAESSTHPSSTLQTSEPWVPPHWETSSTPFYSPTVKTTPEVTSETIIHEVTSTKTTEVPRIPVTSKLVVTSATSAAATTTTAKTSMSPQISTAEIPATTTRKLATPSHPPAPGIPETLLTSSSTKAPLDVVTTTLRPVILQPIAETTHPVTGRVEVSTRSTTPPPPSWSPLHISTSTAAPRPTTVQDRVTTRLVSTAGATPARTTTTIARTTTVRTTPRVTPRITSTERSTIRPVTARVTVATRLPPVTSSSTTLGPLTVTPSPGTTTTSVMPSTTVPTTADLFTTASTTELADTTAAVPRPTTVTAPVPVPTTTTVTTTIVPMTTTRESATSEITLTTKEREVSTSTSHVVTPPPDTHLISTQKPGIPTPASASPPAVTSAKTTEQDRVDRTSPGATTPPVPGLPYTALETTRHTAEGTTSMAVSPTRMCTPPYAEIVDECTKYICVNHQLVLFNKSQSCPFTSDPPNCGLLGFAILVNGDKCCPKWDCPCRCSMFPDLNVITFDGNSVAIYKAASYIVTQLPNETVSIMVQECPADSESPSLWNFTNLCLVALNITHKSNHIIINRLQRRLYVNSRYAKPRYKKFGFEIYDTGNMYLIRSPAGLKLQWYHSTGMMVIDTDRSRNKLNTMGLCGFCDGDPTNDLTLANGTTVGASEDPAIFIDSWQVPNTTSYISNSRRRELNCSTSNCSVCMLMLQNDAFSPCHAFVPPSTFCEVWVRDAEYVNNQCVALAAYVASCHKFNICIEWRTPDYCPFLCPDTLRYQACLPTCTSQSCPNHDFDSDPDQCSGLTEGCVCPEGTLLHRPYSALCISPEKCACTDSSGVPRAYGEVWKASKDACCMYRCDNDIIVPIEYNCSNIVAPLCHRAGEVIISLADDTSCCPQKVCVCNQSLCDMLPPECKYGEKLVSYYKQDSCCPDYVCECDPELCESDVPTCREDQSLIATRADGSCCLAYICMCSSCLEMPPLCQDGEVLTVDSNTTDRCCPAYQCVCEPYRCPELGCPVGMSVVSVSSPGRCCPNQTCECTCEKITSPKCGLGEAAQLDRAFLSDPQNQCACKRYKCVREAVCVFGERGVLRPGQTLVEHRDDGLCQSRQCSRILDLASGFHLLRTNSINCSAHCQPNQIYVPPKDQTTCCGVCKNISCIYEHENGTTVLYKPGKSWVSNCMKFDCTDTLSGPTLISYSFSCPPFNETECMKIGGTVVSYMDGCCKTCKEDGKSCQKVTVRMTIRKNDCRSNRPVNIVSCDGKCPSASIYNYNINTYARFCKCCRETGLQRRAVQLYCTGNATWVSYTIQEPTDCSCQWS
ncbi:LOW QUALITY PROTEIN: otogelin [Cottoperca gobio]|uniref:LOW QUALITY PROTEIN: otogelin n=1 Tax=Cottoperca gobio TaxID=56716 RepID=A0A6J2P6V2_COTGO|nr:LOW QUALITY PROTEIN: otogelin-like [Cottoperca gobio]